MTNRSRSLPSRNAATRLLPTALLVMGAAGPGLLVPAVAPAIELDFALPERLLGAATAVFWLSGAVLSPVAGRVVDRWGARRGVELAVGLGALGSLGVAAFATSPLSLTALLAVGGAANAFAIVGASALTSHMAGSAGPGLALGVQQAGSPLAAVGAGLALPAIAAPLGWRWAFVASAVLILTAGAMLRSAGRQRPPAAPRTPLPNRRAALALIATGAALGTATAGALLAFVVVFAVDKGFSELEAGVLLMGASVSAGAARVGLGILADRRRRDELSRVARLVVAGAIGFPLVATGTPAGIAAGALMVASFGWGFPALLMLAVIRLEHGRSGTAVSWVLAGCFAGAVLGPLTAGLIAHEASLTAVWWLCAAGGVLGGAAITIGRRLTQPGSEPNRAAAALPGAALVSAAERCR